MRKTGACCWLFLLTALNVAADRPEHSLYEWRQPLEGETKDGGRYRVTIPGVVYDKAVQFPADVRIIDAGGDQWPYAALPPPRTETRVLKSAERNRSIADEGQSYHRVDLEIRDTSGGGTHDRVEIRTSGTRFIRIAEVYGAETAGEWALLGKGYLIDEFRPRRVEQRAVLYPKSTFKHLQVRVYPNARDATESFRIVSVGVQRLVHKASIPAPPMDQLAIRRMPVGKEDARDAAEVLMADLGHRNRPFHKVRFICDRKDYVRTACVYGRDNETDPWRDIGGGDIQALDGIVRNTVSVNGRHRYVKCEVFHYDDRPLGIDAIEVLAVPEVFVVEARSAGPACLYVGTEFPKAPRYDLAKRLARIPPATLPMLTLGELEPNEDYRRGGFGELGPWLAGIAVGLVSLLVIAVIVKMMKQEPGQAGLGT